MRPQVYGTAFPILPGVFATAGHVAKAAMADGIIHLGHIDDDLSVSQYDVEDVESIDGIDFSLVRCKALAGLSPLPLEFDVELDIFDTVSAAGFPMAVDPQWLTIVHRGFVGRVITRRTIHQLPAQPPGYELSFPSLLGLSGAPAISQRTGDHRCYGYVCQNSELGSDDDVRASFAIAVDIKSLLSAQSRLLDGPIANVFGRAFVPPRPAKPPHFPKAAAPQEHDLEGWPDEPLG